MRQAILAATIAIIAGAGGSAFAQNAVLTICVKRVASVDEDFDASFSLGPIRVPAGAVFDYAGHAFGSPSDPIDSAHWKKDGSWSGVDASESSRRSKVLAQDLLADQKHKAGLVTLAEVTLTKGKPCTTAPVAAAQSDEWGWTVTPVFGARDVYFQLYGVIRGQDLNTAFDNERNPLDYSGARGSLNGMLSGTTARTIRVPH